MKKDINACIMFSDIVGYSKLQNPNVYLMTVQLFDKIAEILEKHKNIIICKNTWGDGLYCVFKGRNVKEAANIALDIRDLFREIPNGSFKYTKVPIRIAIHFGYVRIVKKEPISGSQTCIGEDVTKAARIEPIVAPNQVFASKSFYEELKKYNLCPDTFKAIKLGKRKLAKGAGEEELVCLGKPNERIDKKELKKQNANNDLIPIFTYSKSEKFRKDIYLLANQLAKQESGAEFYSLFINNPGGIHTDFFNRIEKKVEQGKLKFLRTLSKEDPEKLKGKYPKFYHPLVDPFLSESRALQEILPNAIIYVHKNLNTYRAFLSFCDMKQGYGLGLYTENEDIVIALKQRIISYRNKISHS